MFADGGSGNGTFWTCATPPGPAVSCCDVMGVRGVPANMNEACDALLETLKKVAVILKAAQIPFAVGGSYGVYARGGPSSEHDVDILLKEPDVARAVKVLSEHGMRPVSPPEDWLEKVY